MAIDSGLVRGMNIPRLVYVFSMAAIFSAGMAGSIRAQEDYIAGTRPFERPPGAPVITTVNHDRAWYQRGLTGVVPPYPESLLFLENQGEWYTPFTRPGMTGPYDIRGWHR